MLSTNNSEFYAEKHQVYLRLKSRANSAMHFIIDYCLLIGNIGLILMSSLFFCAVVRRLELRVNTIIAFTYEFE